MRTAALVALVLSPLVAHAEGEHGPMVGGALVATRAPQAEVGGVELELAFWSGHFGIAGHASHQEGIDNRVTTVGGSARVLLYDTLTPSLFEPREDVELGIEAHAIIERAWWSDDRSPTSYGGGLVLRLRGGTDFSNVLAESRLFVRVMTARVEPMEAGIARTTTMPESGRDISVIVGLGAVFGSGDPDYASRFRPRPLDTSILPVN